MQRQGSLAIVSPCASSSRQIAHSPTSLARTSSEKQTGTSHHWHNHIYRPYFIIKHYSIDQNVYYIIMSVCRYTLHCHLKFDIKIRGVNLSKNIFLLHFFWGSSLLYTVAHYIFPLECVMCSCHQGFCFFYDDEEPQLQSM